MSTGKHAVPGRVFALIAAVAMLALALCAGCAASSDDGTAADGPAAAAGNVAAAYSQLDSYDHSDMSGYDAFGPDDETAFVSMTVADIAAEMEVGSTFAVFCGFADCPWCNVLVPYLNDVALERGLRVGYLDTRADPSWESNTDIADYDLFVDLFGQYLEDDDEGEPHLYTPFVIFIADGEPMAIQDGTVPSQESAEDPLTSAQEAELVQALSDKFDQLM